MVNVVLTVDDVDDVDSVIEVPVLDEVVVTVALEELLDVVLWEEEEDVLEEEDELEEVALVVEELVADLVVDDVVEIVEELTDVVDVVVVVTTMLAQPTFFLKMCTSSMIAGKSPPNSNDGFKDEKVIGAIASPTRRPFLKSCMYPVVAKTTRKRFRSPAAMGACRDSIPKPF